MTYFKALERSSRNIVAACAAGMALGLAFAAPVAAQTAQSQAAPSFIVKASSAQAIRMGVNAFRKSNFDQAVTYNIRALETGLSPKRKAIAYSNLCAAYGKLEDYAKAVEACNASLAIKAKTSEASQNLKAAQRGLALAQK